MEKLRNPLELMQPWVRLFYYRNTFEEDKRFPEIVCAIDNSKAVLEDRLIFQKGIMLLEWIIGIDGFSYRYDLGGPYSSQLSNEAQEVRICRYQERKVSEREASELPSDEYTSQINSGIEKLFKLRSSCPVSYSLGSWFELLASIVYTSKWKKIDLDPNLVVELVWTRQIGVDKFGIENVVYGIKALQSIKE